MNSDNGQFRLLRVELSEEDVVLFDVDLAEGSLNGSWTTIVTGRNGSGKSRLLSAIATAFTALDGHRPRRPLSVSVQYLLDGQDCAIQVERGRVSAYLEGRVVDLADLPRPRAVAAATASAFDKFPLPRDGGPFEERVDELSIYKYLGLRDTRGRISIKAGAHRALEQLFDTNTEGPSRRARVAEVFGYLGYRPTVEVVYNWTLRGRELTGITAPEITPEIMRRFLRGVNRVGSGPGRPEVPAYLFGDESVMRELAGSAQAVRRLGNGREIRLVADFSAPRARHDDPLRMARQLSRAGLAQMSDVVLIADPTGRRVALTDASSGELSLAITLLGIASSIEEQSLVLIDEPEISLHPQWQVDYLARLAGAFADYAGCHFVIATHSPTLVSGSDAERTSTVDLEGARANPIDSPTGKSVDEVLVREFGVANDGNLYLRQLLVDSLRLVADRKTQSKEFMSGLADLKNAARNLPDDSPIREVVRDLEQVRDVAGGMFK